MTEQDKKRIEEAARYYAVNHSSAPDKETPDWIISDFKAGVEYENTYAYSKSIQLLNWLLDNGYIKIVLTSEDKKYFQNWKTPEDVFNEFQNK